MDKIYALVLVSFLLVPVSSKFRKAVAEFIWQVVISLVFNLLKKLKYLLCINGLKKICKWLDVVFAFMWKMIIIMVSLPMLAALFQRSFGIMLTFVTGQYISLEQLAALFEICYLIIDFLSKVIDVT